MRSEFQDVFKDAYDHWIDYACSQRYYASRNLALHVWNHQQSKIDALTLQVAEMKSRLNDAYTDGQSAMYAARQSEVDGLQKQRDSFIKAYDIEMGKNIELQKRVDSILKVVQSMRNEVKHGHMSDEEAQMLSSFADELEQALKGDQ